MTKDLLLPHQKELLEWATSQTPGLITGNSSHVDFQEPPLPRPAGMSGNCDAWLPNPNPDPDAPRLLRCRRKARRRVTIKTVTDCYTLKRCQVCTDELHQKVGAGATFEILNDEGLSNGR